MSNLQDHAADAIRRAIVAKPKGIPRPLLKAARIVHRKQADSNRCRLARERFARMLPKYSAKLPASLLEASNVE